MKILVIQPHFDGLILHHPNFLYCSLNVTLSVDVTFSKNFSDSKLYHCSKVSVPVCVISVKLQFCTVTFN